LGSMTSYDILVVILSIALAIFLTLGIVCLTLAIKLLNSIKQVIAKGEHLVDSAEALSETLRRNAGAAGLLKMLMSFVNTVSKIKK
jgi:CHASE3 domain sensor protein